MKLIENYISSKDDDVSIRNFKYNYINSQMFGRDGITSIILGLNGREIVINPRDIVMYSFHVFKDEVAYGKLCDSKDSFQQTGMAFFEGVLNIKALSNSSMTSLDIGDLKVHPEILYIIIKFADCYVDLGEIILFPSVAFVRSDYYDDETLSIQWVNSIDKF